MEVNGARTVGAIQPRETVEVGHIKFWTPMVLYPLQPAPHFAGRVQLLNELTTWMTTPDAKDRVVAIVAVGGTGKTALAEKLLTELPSTSHYGVLVWSFYENPQTEAFLRDACNYFMGETPKETGGLLERLQHRFRNDALPHLLILDGLELVQATGASGRPRGELEDPLMRRLLRWLVGGSGTRVKALITSRFPLPDLAAWEGRGFRSINLMDLELPAARAVLRRRSVKGSDAELDSLSNSVHCHALTIDVLGSYLGTYNNGDPSKAPSFDAEFLSDTDSKSAKLQRILTGYAGKMSPQERDLLARLSVFPRGVKMDVLEHLIRSGGQAAASLSSCGPADILKLVERLRGMGLVFRYNSEGIDTFTAHPFLRTFFEKLIDFDGTQCVLDTILNYVYISLAARPNSNSYPTRPEDLKLFEQYIEILRIAHRHDDAIEMYKKRLGSYEHLAWTLGEYSLGLRVLSSLFDVGSVETLPKTLTESQKSRIVTDCGLYAMELGDLTTARLAFDNTIQLKCDVRYNGLNHNRFTFLCELHLLSGRWKQAYLAATAADIESQYNSEEAKRVSCAYLANSAVYIGKLEQAEEEFQNATKFQGRELYSLLGIWQTEFNIRRGLWQDAMAQVTRNLQKARQNRWTDTEAKCRTIYGHLLIHDNINEATLQLSAARQYATSTGSIEVNLRCYQLASEIARGQGNLKLAISEAVNGLQLADSCGFGRWSLDIRLECARIYLAEGNARNAIEPTEWVLKQSREKDCEYAWGIADGLHLLGTALARVGERKQAHALLSDAITKGTSKNKFQFVLGCCQFRSAVRRGPIV